MRGDPRRIAFGRRLADGPRQRWLWALGSALPGFGVVVLLRHGLSRRTATPALFGLTALAAVGFAIGSYAGFSPGPARPGQEQTRGPGWPLTVLAVAAGVGVFAFGHKHGQDRAAQEAARWLDLDR
jgi:drug/metabolite transporter (DMT)-like permease